MSAITFSYIFAPTWPLAASVSEARNTRVLLPSYRINDRVRLYERAARLPLNGENLGCNTSASPNSPEYSIAGHRLRGPVYYYLRITAPHKILQDTFNYAEVVCSGFPPYD
jgi:hypothetical protein